MHCFKLLISKSPCYVVQWSRYMPVRCEALCWGILTVSHWLDTCHLCAKFNFKILSLKHAINFVPRNEWDPRNEVRICINHWLIMLQHMPSNNFDMSVCDWEQVALFINSGQMRNERRKRLKVSKRKQGLCLEQIKYWNI